MTLRGASRAARQRQADAGREYRRRRRPAAAYDAYRAR
jgi:hypothetical protein